jgi:hemoglobin-like flavoprotein
VGITVKLNQAEIYQATYRGLYKSLPKWKQELVDQNDKRQTEALAKEVIEYAEKKET